MTTFPTGGHSSLFQDAPGAAVLPVPPAAIPAASGQLLGGSGVPGLAQAITVGTNLTLDPITHTLNATGGGGGGASSDVSASTVTSPAIISIKPTLTDLTSAFKPFDFFGGKASNADNLAALNAWVAYGGPVLIPAGRFIVSAAPNTLTNKTAALVGLGDGTSLLVFSAGSGGLSISQDDYTHVTHVRDLTLVTQSTTDIGTALAYADASADVNAHRFQHRLSIQRVGIRGDALETMGWANGLVLTDPQVSLLDTITITGRNNSVIENNRAGYGHMTAGISIIGGAEIATDIDIRSARVNNCRTGISVTGHFEGLRIDGGLINNAWIGVGASMSSLRPGTTIDGLHVNAFDACLSLSSVAQAKITNNLLYKHPTATAATTAIALSGCSIASVEGNLAVNQTASFGAGGAWTFLTAANSDHVSVLNNQIERPSGVTVFSGTTSVCVATNNTALGSLSGASFVQHADTSSGTNYSDTFTVPLASNSVSPTTGQVYAVPTSGSAALLRSDGTVAALLDAPSVTAGFSTHRPFGWNLSSGDVAIAGDGATTSIYGPLIALSSATFSGAVSMSGATSVLVPTATAGDNTTKAASTAFVTNAVSAATAGVASFNARTGTVTLTSADVTGALTFTPYNATNPSGYQTAAQVSSSISAAAYSLPTATTTILGGVKVDGTTITIASGVISAAGGGGVSLAVAGTDPVPVIDGTAAVGTSSKAAREDHVHPTDTSRLSVTTAASTYLPLAGGALTGAVTLSPGAVAGLTINNAGAAGPTSALTLTNTTGVGGVNLHLIGDGGTTPGKYIRATAGVFQVLNDAYNTALLNITDAGTVTLAVALPVASGGTGATTAAAARTSLGVSATAFGISFDQGAVVANGTITVVRKAPFAMTINSLDYEVGSAGGSFTVAVQIAGTNVTGLSAVAVSSSTSANAAATAANTVAAGQAITIVISSTTGSPTGANLQINATR